MYPEGEEILVVDGDDTRRGAIVTILSGEGFPVTPVSAGLAALRLVGERRFALVVAAMHLPGTLDGVATMRQARLRRPGLKALLVADHVRRPALGEGRSGDVIAAPFHRWELLGCVFEMLQRTGADEATDLARRCRGLLLAS